MNEVNLIDLELYELTWKNLKRSIEPTFYHANPSQNNKMERSMQTEFIRCELVSDDQNRISLSFDVHISPNLELRLLRRHRFHCYCVQRHLADFHRRPWKPSRRFHSPFLQPIFCCLQRCLGVCMESAAICCRWSATRLEEQTIDGRRVDVKPSRDVGKTNRSSMQYCNHCTSPLPCDRSSSTSVC